MDARPASRLRVFGVPVSVGLLLRSAAGFVLFTSMFAAMGARLGDYRPGRFLEVTRRTQGAFVKLRNGTLRVQPCGAGVARITFFHGTVAPDLSTPAILQNVCKPADFSLHESPGEVKLALPGLTVVVDKASGALRFENPAGKVLLAEEQHPYPRRLDEKWDRGRQTGRAAVWFALRPEERLYGLGQHQTGLLDQRNLEFVLSQDNTNISIPLWLSSGGYGVLWNQASVTHWNNRFRPILAVESHHAAAIDYFFLAGPNFDPIVSGYRRLTGSAPLMPRWAYGFWQSRLRYASQQELLSVARKYRQLRIPIDNIVLDEGWETRLGSREFNSSFPDPAGMVRQLHNEHMHLMVSCWPIFAPGSETFRQFLAHHGFVQLGDYDVPPVFPGARLYDAFNPTARDIDWRQIKKSLYDIGVDAYWLDSTEPLEFFGEEHGPMLAGARTAMGNGSRYANLYPLMATGAVYRGQRNAGDRRVFLLSRSAFLGMQRHAAAAWSGDVAADFSALRRQIPAGLNYSLTGLPYWTTDIGGFLGGDTRDPAYQEVFIRWFQYGTFCPVFRVHGDRINHENELWSYGRRAQDILTSYVRLRYRLLPYIYSIAARTTFEGYTPMRALAFDFRRDTKALDIADEFLFGPSILVAPVTAAGAQSRTVYLPGPARWYDFWSGAGFEGGRNVVRETPLEIMPIYVRAGSILPLIDGAEYAQQMTDAPIDLRIYPGADADFCLYQDDGISYGYERGEASRIPLHWDDRTHVLTIGARGGGYPGENRQQTFRLVLAGPKEGHGAAIVAARQTVKYSGAAIRVYLPDE